MEKFMNHTLKAAFLAGGVLSLMATGALAASTAADEGQAAGKTTKQAGPTSGMKAERRSEGNEHSAMKGDEHREKASVHARGEAQSRERTKITAETDRSARTHRYSYNTGPD